MYNIEKDVKHMKENQSRNRVDAKVSDIAGRYDVDPSTVHRWVKENHESLVPASEAEKIRAAYEKKIRALEEENEILRKAIHGLSDIER